MNHNRLMFAAVLAYITDGKSLGKVKVHLNGGTLPGAAQHVPDLEINLGSIKNPFSGIHLVMQILLFQSGLQGMGCLFPVLL